MSKGIQSIFRCAIFALLLFVLLLSVSISLADTKYTASGNGEDTSIFYVQSNGNAKITFKQEEGLCRELSYTHLIDGLQGDEEEWGKYHIYVTKTNGGGSVENWDKTRRGSTYELKLQSAGLYEIKVVPYTAYEMTESWTLDKFLWWTQPPQWWVDNLINCSVKEPMSSDTINIEYYYRSGKNIETRDVETLTIDKSKTIQPRTIDGYICISDPEYVSFDMLNGASPKKLKFIYIRNKVTITNIYIKSDNSGVHEEKKSFTVTFDKNGYAPAETKQGYYCIMAPELVSFDPLWGVNKSAVSYVHIYGLTDARYTYLHNLWYERFKDDFQEKQKDSSYRALVAAMMADVPNNSDAEYYAFLAEYAKQDLPGASSTARKPGDANGDGNITMADAMLIARKACGHSVTVNISNSDVNQDGSITMADAMLVARKACGHSVVLK
ncbi:MAG: hypothetical protein IKN04_12490 [Clostridia bacterium]|nr:hypothetical protein [Clostridia bacterium]